MPNNRQVKYNPFPFAFMCLNQSAFVVFVSGSNIFSSDQQKDSKWMQAEYNLVSGEPKSNVLSSTFTRSHWQSAGTKYRELVGLEVNG